MLGKHFDFIGCVSDGIADAGGLDHRSIIVVVSDSHHVVHWNVETVGKCSKRYALLSINVVDFDVARTG